MTDEETAPRQAETVPVTLARMEGKFDLVVYRTGVIEATIAGHGKEIESLKMGLQRLSDEADADRTTARALAEALEKDAEARRDQSADKWTPFQRAITALSGLTALAAVAIAIVK